MTITAPNQQELWRRLQSHQKLVAGQRIESFFNQETDRYKNFSLTAAGLTLDYSKNLLDETGLQLLLELAEETRLDDAIQSLFRGDIVNTSEQRPALHTALRNGGQGLPANLQQEIVDCQQRVDHLVEKLHNKQWLGAKGKAIKDVVNIGIGGSDVGPAMACLALRPYDQQKLRVHFVSNMDGTPMADKINGLDPYTTLFIVASKSFTTLETHKNAQSARQWLIDSGIPQQQLRQHFIAITSNKKAATEFGIAAENIFPLWDWVGGRYSIWSAIGISIALQIGTDNFNQFLAGAAAMDDHFRTATFRNNMPVILGLLAIWYNNFFNASAQFVIPYDHYLNKFPVYLQQLEMESNGKSVQHDGKPVDHQTMGAIFGGTGSNSQHSFHQLLFQGTRFFPVDFIIPAQSHNPIADQHTLLVANCIAQSRALMVGRDLDTVISELQQQGADQKTINTLAPHKVVAGNKPSNILTMAKLTPATLGAMIALYEHKVYVQSILWNIDAFDQWGVELGKELSQDIYTCLTGNNQQQYDESTNALIAYFQDHSK